MDLSRRSSLRLAAKATAFSLVSQLAWAQAYPSRPVRVIVPFAAAGGTDILARLIAQWLSQRLGQQFVVENRPGAGGTIGTEAVVRSPPDGYTLLISDASSTISATLYDKLNFNFAHDIAPVAYVLRSPFLMVVSPALPVKTVPEFFAYARTNPGKINMASSGIGTPPHVTGELFKMMTGIDMVTVHYRGAGPAITDLIGGQVQLLFVPPPSVTEHVRAGTLRALAVTAATRFEGLPDLPTLREFVPGFEASNTYGVGAPRNTPPDLIDRLNKEINVGLADPKLKAKIVEFGGSPVMNSPAEFARLIAADAEKWGKVVKFAAIRPE
jgi:tripartite-type tricarboxylate transporter receptor subunit TctC